MAIILTSFCEQCRQNDNKTTIASGELSNDEFSIIKCPVNHETKYFAVLPDYQIYFDHGIDAYADSNYFEAFTSIYHSWEQFLLVFVETILIIHTGETYDKIQQYTKNLSKNSVQIEGAFEALYASFFKETPPVLPNSLRALRNKIIHGKRNPEKKDVEGCITAIYNFIKPIEIKMFMDDVQFSSYFEIYGAMKLKHYQEKRIITEEDKSKGLCYIVQSGQYNLGMSPRTSEFKTAVKILTFEELVQKRKRIRSLEKIMEQQSK
ncbi:MAG: hypothetical protein ACOYEB_00660 [Enterococcus lemanii]|jgi:hypothetical protein